jgi:glycosyltransferase involved in cell wall biosynthesis
MVLAIWPSGQRRAVRLQYVMPSPISLARRSSHARNRSLDATRPVPRILCVGGEDHDLRIPFLLAIREHGFGITAAGTAAPEPFAKAGVDYRPFRFQRFINPRADWMAIQALADIVADIRPSIVQSFDTKPAVLAPFATRRVGGIPVVRTINGMGWLYSSRSPTALALRPAYRILHQLASRATTMTIFQNRVDEAFFARHGMAAESARRLIPGSGIDIAGFDRAIASAPSAAAVRATLGLGTAEIVVTVARLTRQKGIPTLLEAARLIHHQRRDVRFLLVGPRESEGPFAIPQQELDRHRPYVLPVGRRSDVPSLLRLADVFAFPTVYREGVPRVLLEAALANLPIVTTDMPGCSDVVHDGWSGLTVAPRSPRALADAILRLLTDRPWAQAMASRAADLVRQEFGLELTAARYAKLYIELVREHAHNGSARAPGTAQNRD